ncbi:MAG: glycosyltransferase [Elusimicrobia bacterium]|nr:glycosyltransferase [Candidatus Obscuribacterium magneticum]
MNYETAFDKEGVLIDFKELKTWIRNGSLIKKLFRYRKVELITYRLGLLPKPFLTCLLLRSLTIGDCRLKDKQNHEQAVTFALVFRLFRHLLMDGISLVFIYRWVKKSLCMIGGSEKNRIHSGKRLDLRLPALYVRTDLSFGVVAGGSVGHIAGVVNNMDQWTAKPLMITSDRIPTVRDDIESHIVLPEARFWDYNEIPSFFYNVTLFEAARAIIGHMKFSFVYQRYSRNNFVGLRLAECYGIPFVLEYNGPEVWIGRHWGNRLPYEALTEEIELLNLRKAEMIVVVSRVIHEELERRGIDKKKVVFIPNGVDTNQYHPGIDGGSVRKKYGLEGKIVIGFIGTFGRWHGAEVLAEAAGLIFKFNPSLGDKIHFLLIGDGPMMPQVRETIAKYDVSPHVTLPGLLPQREGPRTMAACDILVASHIPNPDGTPFFGSPTKLFEYMAMGKGIVASRLDQIGDLLAHGRTAWLVEPGDPHSLQEGIQVLVNDFSLCQRLGQAAREEVVARYTWRAHTQQIIQKLKEVTHGA